MIAYEPMIAKKTLTVIQDSIENFLNETRQDQKRRTYSLCDLVNMFRTFLPFIMNNNDRRRRGRKLEFYWIACVR